MKIERKQIECILFMLFISILCILPCAGKRLPYGDDMTFHMLRIESVHHAIKTGQGFPAYIYDKLMEGYGYGAGIFYPDILLLPAVLLRGIGFSPIGAMTGYIFILLLLTSYTSYMAGRIVGGSHLVGLIMMILYTLGLYHLEDVYIRSAIGEVVAMAFIPLVACALYNFTEDKKQKRGLLCISFAGVMLCHTISFVLCVILAIVWVIFRIHKIWNKKHILWLLAEAISCIVITSFYWIPVLEQFTDGSFYVNSNPAFKTQNEMMTFFRIVSGRFSVSFIELSVFLIFVLLGARSGLRNKKALCCFGISMGLLIIETRVFPWNLVDQTPFVSLQFPWRLNMFTEFFVALGIGLQLQELYRYLDSIRRVYILGLIMCVVIGCYNLYIVWPVGFIQSKKYTKNYMETVSNTNDVGCYEWLPSEVNKNENYSREGKGIISLYGLSDNKTYGEYNSNGSYIFEVEQIYDSCVIPKYYYKGYKASVMDIEGSQMFLPVSKDPDTGLVRLELNGKTGTVRVWYGKTVMQMISKWISLISLLFIVAFGVIRFITKHKSERENTDTQYI